MRSAVIIPTLGRAGLAENLIAHLEKQCRLPDEVIVSAADRGEFREVLSDRFPIKYLYGSRGLCAQRNRALEYALATSDIITFFDDDFLPSNHYLKDLVAAFSERPDWAAIMGNVIYDGARCAGLTFDQGLAYLQAAVTPQSEPRVTLHPGLYGCNMSFRSNCIGSLRFDERLVLYGWQEDIDFSSQLRRHGLLVCFERLTGVHLGFKTGRVSGVRLGYSQIANPVYLLRKGTMPVRFACALMARNFMANAAKSLRPEPYVDRRGRLKGNLLAVCHVITGRVEPEYISNL